MGSLFGVLGVVREGLAAQQAAVALTGQNVANANTPGYVRRQAILAGNAPTGGVTYQGVNRSFDQFTYGRLVEEQGKQGSATARSNALSQLEGIVAPSSGGIGDQVDTMMASLQALTGAPSDVATRAAVLGNAQNLAASISNAATGIQKSRDAMLSDAQGVAANVNQSLSSIAKLNGQIANAVATGNDASSLKDQRDQLVTDVASKIGAKTIAGDNGQITLFAAGTTLVDGNTASSISVQADANDNLQIQAHRSDGTTLDVTSYVADGSLGGIKEARDTDATSTLNQLDQYAYDLSNAFNAINASGYGTDGTTGNNIFVAPASVTGAAKAMALDPGIIGKPEKIAASSTAAGLPGGNDLAVKLAGLASAPLGATTQSPTARFATIASSLGIAKQSADNEVSLRQSTVAQAQTMNDSASGVSLDEEMINLTQYQRAFQASSKVLQAVDELLQNLIQSL